MFKRLLHTYTEEEGVTFELKGEIVDGACTAFVKGTINGEVTVDGKFETKNENAEVELNQFFSDAFKAHGEALEKAFPVENKVVQ